MGHVSLRHSLHSRPSGSAANWKSAGRLSPVPQAGRPNLPRKEEHAWGSAANINMVNLPKRTLLRKGYQSTNLHWTLTEHLMKKTYSEASTSSLPPTFMDVQWCLGELG